MEKIRSIKVDFLFMKMMLPDVIGHENQSQHYQHHRCLFLDLSGRITTPTDFHTTPKPRQPSFPDFTYHCNLLSRLCSTASFRISSILDLPSILRGPQPAHLRHQYTLLSSSFLRHQHSDPQNTSLPPGKCCL